MQYEDYEYFIENTARFYRDYGARFLAIKDRNIIGVYQTFGEALRATLKTEAAGTFLIQQCLKKPEDGVVRMQGNFIPVPAKGADAA